MPRLDELERERLALFEKRRIRIQITIVATVIGAGLSLLLVNEYSSSSHRMTAGMWKLFPILVAAGVGSFWVGKLHRAHQESLREIIVPAVCRFFDGLEYARDPGERFDHKRFFELGVVPAASHFTEKVRLEDMFIGRHRDTAFRMVDAEFQRKSGRHTTTVFDGLLFEIAVPAKFSGRVLIGEDKGDFGEESRVEFDHPDFKDRYAVYASDADEARRLVSPEFCDTMVALADAFDKKSLGAAFVDGVFLLAVPVPGDLFAPGSIARSVYDCEDDIHEFLKELTIAHRVIDYLRPLANVPPRHQALGVPVVAAAGRIGTRRRPSSRTRIDRALFSLFSVLKVALSWGMKAGLVGLVGGFFGGCLHPAAGNMCWFWGIILAPPAFIVVTWLALHLAGPARADAAQVLFNGLCRDRNLVAGPTWRGLEISR